MVALETVTASASPIEVHFSPNGGAEAAVVAAIAGARSTLDVAIYSMSSHEITAAIEDAARRGVGVRMAADKGQRTEGYSTVPELSCFFPVRYDTFSGLLHDKYAVIDGREVVTGSFNWTASAESRNGENLLVIDDADLAAAYEANFEAIWTSHSSAAPSCSTAAAVAAAPTAEVAAESQAPVSLSVDPVLERATITNSGSSPLDLSGWTLVSVTGNQRFVLPAGTTLGAGAALVIESGRSATAGPDVIVWTHSNVWNNSGDPGELYDASGNLIAQQQA